MKRFNQILPLFVLASYFFFQNNLIAQENWLLNPVKTELSKWNQPMFSVKFSASGKYYAVSGWHAVEVYNANHQKVWEHRDGISDGQDSRKPIAFSQDEAILCIGNLLQKGEIIVVRLSDLQASQKLDTHAYYVQELDFSPNGQYLTSVASGPEIAIFQYQNAQLTLKKKIDDVHDQTAFSVSFSPDGKKNDSWSRSDSTENSPNLNLESYGWGI